MRLAKTLPFPGHRLQTQEMAEDDRVGAGVGHDNDPPVGIVDSPEMTVLLVHGMDAVGVECLLEPGHHTLMKCPERLTTRQPIPHLLHRAEVGVSQCLFDLFDRSAIPLGWVVDLLKPVVDLGFGPEVARNRVGGPHGPVHRGDPELVDPIQAGEAMCHPSGLLVTELGEIGIVSGQSIRGPVRLPVTDEEEIHDLKPRPDRINRRHRVSVAAQYHVGVPVDSLIEHLRSHALRTDGPFTLRSGAVTSWYLDARQTTFSGDGAWLVGEAVLEVVDPAAQAIGGMTMGADPIAVATAMVAARNGRELSAFSIRKAAKDHGTGGRVVGPVPPGTRVVILEDTTTTGGAAVEATEAAVAEGLDVIQAIALVDRSGDRAGEAFAERGIPYVALVRPSDLGVVGE